MTRITEQHGFDITAQRETELHPPYAVAWAKRRDALKVIREVVNEHDDRVAQLELEAGRRPFG